MFGKGAVPAPHHRRRDSRDKAAGSSSTFHNIWVEVTRQGAVLRRGGRTVGEVRGSVFRKTVRRSRHLLRTACAWCWDLDALRAAADLGARSVLVRDADTGAIYAAPLDVLRKKGFRVNLGCGEQWALKLCDFPVRPDAGFPESPDPAGPRQLALAGV